MNLVLYRKYRPQKLQDIIGQEIIINTLQAALKQQSVGHALIFTGPRGVGKTSLARIMAHELNGVDYHLDQMPLDIIEIDAASSGRIDEVRDLKNKIKLMPLELKYKVYIIDEVHMLTKEAFNALLKTLEEPPEHIFFILATTEIHKVPATVISRCQYFAFKAISVDVLAEHLKKIAKLEKIKLKPQAATLIAQHAQGSLRDSLSLLEQLASLQQVIEVSLVEEMLGLPNQTLMTALTEALLDNDFVQITKAYQNLIEQGVDAVILTTQLTQRLRDCLREEKDSKQRERILLILKDLLDVYDTFQPDIVLEITLFRHVQPI